MLEGQACRLGEVIAIKHGFAFPGGDFSDDPSFPSLVTPGNFAVGGGFKHAKPKTFAGDFPSEYRLASGDLVVTMTDLSKEGATLGLPAVVPAGRSYLHNQRIGLVEVRDTDRVTAPFLHYYLRTAEYRSHILATATGSTVRHTSPSRICSFVAHLPPVPTQRDVAELLGALDDKIAANWILTDTAVSLIDAEYARCSQKSVLSELTFGDVADVGGGSTPRTSVEGYWDGSVPWATPTDVTALRGPYLTTTSREISEAGLAACSSPLYPPGSILMTSRATIGAFAIAQQSMAVNQGFIVVNAHEADWQWWLFHDMRSRVDEFVSHANGATFLELSRGKFKQFRVRLVDGAARKEFEGFAGAVHGRAGAAMVESVQLAATRDTLLPQLMSGSIRIKDAERLVGEVI